jgi:hypothetical protein
MVVIFAITVGSEPILFIIVLMPRNSIVGCDTLSVFDIVRGFLVRHAGGWRGRGVAHCGNSNIQSQMKYVGNSKKLAKK